jgi:hypothetical protein
MKLKICIAIVCLLAFALVSAHAATVVVSQANYANLGWKMSIKPGSDGKGSLAFSLRSENWENGLMGLAGKSSTSFCAFSGLSMSLAPGTPLSSITTLRMRSMETQGVLTEPMSVGLGVVVWDDVNSVWVNHNLRPLPYETRGYRGTQWVMEEYDLLGSMLWLDNNGGVKKTWTAFLADNPTAKLATDAEIDGGIYSGQNFNAFVGEMKASAAEYPYGRDQRGQMDWVEIGFGNDEVTRYDFNVPEPSSLLALLSGIAGVVAFRRKR